MLVSGFLIKKNGFKNIQYRASSIQHHFVLGNKIELSATFRFESKLPYAL